MHTPEPIIGTVLLIDREERLARQKAAFEQEGMSVVTATTTEDGLAKARTMHPDLVISEVMLEKPDAGFVLGYRMKADPELADVPLILLSSVFQSTGRVFDQSTPESRRWIKADAYVERPIAADRLLAKVRALLQPTGPARH
jgi:DNA-binding response OmpR family regulator